MAVAPPAGQSVLPHHKICSEMAQQTQQRAQGVDPTSSYPRYQSDQASVGCAGTSLIHEGPTPQHVGPK